MDLELKNNQNQYSGVTLQVLKPFPGYAIDSSLLSPQPQLKVRGFKGDPSELLIICAKTIPEKLPLKISQEALLSSDSFTFIFDNLSVTLENTDLVEFRFEFNLVHRGTFQVITSCLSPTIKVLDFKLYNTFIDEYILLLQHLENQDSQQPSQSQSQSQTQTQSQPQTQSQTHQQQSKPQLEIEQLQL